MPRQLFLSHSGIDTDAANAIKVRMLASPAAREQELRVWFDKDDLCAGETWQPQIEEAIADSHAFAVYVGSKGVVNWVEAEVRLALNRAITNADFRFIPILSGVAADPEALPGFARQFQGVFDVEARADEFDKLMRAVLGGAEAGQLQLETEPFFGLHAIDESRNHLFFGREKETKALLERMHRTRLLLVTGDSGSGKSSLVRAGLVPRFRGGALAIIDGGRSADTLWHVVTTQPRIHPFRQLGEAVDSAAKNLGLSLAERGTLAGWAASGEINKVRWGLRCDLPPERVQVLLVVDQFEELLTITPPSLRGPFIDLLLDLSDPLDGHFRVVLTMRHDYVNLCSPFKRLSNRLDADNRRARFRLGRISDEGLRKIVTKPLHLAGVDRADREALAAEVLRDVGERPGDLALAQMALTETWQAQAQNHGSLLRAYSQVGRVEGALAQAAERVRMLTLPDEARAQLEIVLLRLVRLGDTGGATRRVAARNEFDNDQWSLIETLASREGKRLVLLGGSTEHPTVEIAHEALVTAWPYFQNVLQKTLDQKRVLDTLIGRTLAWAEQEDSAERAKRLATGADLEAFTGLADRYSAWISGDEHAFIWDSLRAENVRRRRERIMAGALRGVAAALLVASIFAGWQWWRATQERNRAIAAEMVVADQRDKATAEATTARKLARENESRALAAFSEIASKEDRYVDAVKLALAAWPRKADGDRPKLRATSAALGKAQLGQRLLVPPLHHNDSVRGAVFSGDATRILTWAEDGAARLWDATNGQVLLTLQHEFEVSRATFSADSTRILTSQNDGLVRLWDAGTGQVVWTLRHKGSLEGETFNADETRILTWSQDGTARLWDAATGQAMWTLRQEDEVQGATFNADSTRILTWTQDGLARLWDVASRQAMWTLRHEDEVQGATFNADSTRILTWSRDGAARLWDATNGQTVWTQRHEGWVWDATFNADSTRVLTLLRHGTARLWDAANGQAMWTLRHEHDVTGATFNADETRILTWSRDGTARLWDAATGQAMWTLRHEDEVRGATFNADSTRILTWSADGTARLWDATTGQELVVQRHESPVHGGIFSADSTRILTWSYGVARLWDMSSDHALLTLRHEDTVSGATINADSTSILTWSRRGPARLWNASSGQELRTLTHMSGVVGATFNADSTRVLTWSWDGTARLWDTASGQAVWTLRHEARSLGGANFNPDATRFVAYSGDDAVRVWDATSGKELSVLSPQNVGINQMDLGVWGITSDADATRIVTWSFDGIKLWDADTNQVILTLPVLDSINYPPTITNNGSRILTKSTEGLTRVWDATSGELLLTLRQKGAVSSATFNTDTTRILTSSNIGTAHVWDATSGEVLLTIRQKGAVSGAILNAEETRILTWSEDGTARLWDAVSGEELLTLRHENDVKGAVFNTDETRILTWSADGTARLWDVSRLQAGDLIKVACGLLPDHDTAQLKDRYGIEIVEPICGPNTPAPDWVKFVD